MHKLYVPLSYPTKIVKIPANLDFQDLRGFEHLFPFNGARRLGGDVIDNSVHSGHFVADTAAHFVQHFPGEAEIISRHAVGGSIRDVRSFLTK